MPFNALQVQTQPSTTGLIILYFVFNAQKDYEGGGCQMSTRETLCLRQVLTVNESFYLWKNTKSEVPHWSFNTYH